MAKNSVDSYNAEGKTNLLMFDPAKLTIVTEPTHPLFDRRHDMPLDEAMVLNVMHQGVIQPIVVTKNGETGQTEVVAGRQRVKHAVEANRRLVAQGLPPIQVPATVRRSTGDPLALTILMISENEHRRADTPVGRAQKMQLLFDRGASEQQVCMAFGVGAAAVKTAVALLDCTATLRNAVESGKINISTAQKLFKLPPDEQRAKTAEVLSVGDSVKGHAKTAKVRAVVDAGPPKMRGRKEIAAMLARTGGDGYLALAWVLGAADERFAAPAPVST